MNLILIKIKVILCKKISMENSIFSDYLCPPASDSQNESLYNVDKNLNGTFELHSILKFEKSTIFDGLGVQILKSTFL